MINNPNVNFKRASKATYWDKNGILREAGNDEPRLDHDPITREALGLLLKGSNRTQYISDVNNIDWTTDGVLTEITTTDRKFPDITVYNFTGQSEIGEVGRSFIDLWGIIPAGTVDVGTPSTRTVYIRPKGGVRYVNFSPYDWQSNNHAWRTIFDLEEVSVVRNSDDGTGYIEKVGDGWFKLRFDFSTPGSFYRGFFLAFSAVGDPLDEDTWEQLTERQGVDIALPQVFLGLGDSSPIITTGTPATRASDSFSIKGMEFQEIFNPAQGALILLHSSFSVGNIVTLGGLNIARTEDGLELNGTAIPDTKDAYQNLKLRWGSNGLDVFIGSTKALHDIPLPENWDDVNSLVLSNNESADKYVNSLIMFTTAPTDEQMEVLPSNRSGLSTTARNFYLTLANANANITNIAVNQLVAVSEDDNVGLWYKASENATSLSKSPYDPLTQAKEDAKAYTDEKINEIEIAPLTGQELYDKVLRDDTELFSAIWSEYNKPVWHIGNSVFVDAVGAKVTPVDEELVFTLKATQVNQTFYFPTELQAGESFTVDWGDGSTSEVEQYYVYHEYICEIGDEFVVRATGEVSSLEFNNPYVVEDSNAMLISIDKNTLPKVTRAIHLEGCVNLTSVCAGAFSSYSGTALNLQLLNHCPSLVLNKDMFMGLSHVVNIDNLFTRYSRLGVIDQPIPEGLLDVFVNVTSAEHLFGNSSNSIPDNILAKLTELENVFRMFYQHTSPTLSSDLFKNQLKLKNVGDCFRGCEAVSDASILYADMVRGNPITTEACFMWVENMTNLAEVPTEWK